MRASSRSRSFLVLFGLAVILLNGSGCGAPDGRSACAEAAAHLATCTGAEVPPSSSCDDVQAGQADSILASSCDELTSGDGKTDGAGLVCAVTLFAVGDTGRELGSFCCIDRQCEGSSPCFGPLCSGPVACIAYRCAEQRAIGGDCGQDNGACKSALTCLPSKKCGMPQPVGARCDEKSDCMEALRCGSNGRCVEALADGASCRRDDECANTCVVGACAPRSDTGGRCDALADCNGGLVCIEGTCATAVAGSPCQSQGDCFGSARLSCAFGACVSPPKTGEDCDVAAGLFACDSVTNTCYEGICQPRHQAGGPCDMRSDCASGSCINRVCG